MALGLAALAGIAALAMVPLSAMAVSTMDLSKSNSYAVIDDSGLQASKIVTYVVLDSASSEPASAPVGR